MWWCLVLLVALVLSLVQADIIQYHDHFLIPERPEYLVLPKFDKTEVPHWKPGKGRSYIDFSHLKIRSVCYESSDAYVNYPPSPIPYDKDECKAAQFDLLMFEAPMDDPDMPWKDLWEDGEFCCTSEMVNKGECPASKLNTLLVPSTLPSETLLRSTVVKPDEEIYLIPDDQISRHEVGKSGVYVVIMAVCNPDVAPMVVEGSIDSLDPYGYLPADLFGNLPFYLTLSCMYLLIGATWALLCAWHWDQLMPLQFWISGVLCVAMFEATLLFSHYMDWNDNGFPTTPLTVVALIFGVSKRAMSRILVQFVALGYGVVRPSLGEDMQRVLYLGGSYFVLSLIYTIFINVPTSSKAVMETEYDLLSVIVFLLAVIDTAFYVWIFTSINNLMVSLASRKQGTKYVLYRNFRNVLFVMLACTILWAVYGSVIFINDGNGASPFWRQKWTVDALWELIYFVIFVSIAVLWAPSKNSQRYAYSIELTTLEDDSEYNDVANAVVGDDDGELDGEYGGRLHDEKDPFQGTGALDSAMAVQKKN